jgi:hypothetical protein
MTCFGPVPPADGWRARVTEDDIRAARTAWWDARQRGESAARVTDRWDDLVRLFRAEAEEVADHPWRRAGQRYADVPRQRQGAGAPQ